MWLPVLGLSDSVTRVPLEKLTARQPGRSLDCSRATTDMLQGKDRHLHSGHNRLNRLCWDRRMRRRQLLRPAQGWPCCHLAGPSCFNPLAPAKAQSAPFHRGQNPPAAWLRRDPEWCVHFGQFAATPAGLTVGQTIPANFGQLQPINRWSARFGFITYKTLSLGNLTKSSTKTSTDQTPAPSTTTKPPSAGNAKPTS